MFNVFRVSVHVPRDRERSRERCARSRSAHGSEIRPGPFGPVICFRAPTVSCSSLSFMPSQSSGRRMSGSDLYSTSANCLRPRNEAPERTTTTRWSVVDPRTSVHSARHGRISSAPKLCEISAPGDVDPKLTRRPDHENFPAHARQGGIKASALVRNVVHSPPSIHLSAHLLHFQPSPPRPRCSTWPLLPPMPRSRPRAHLPPRAPPPSRARPPHQPPATPPARSRPPEPRRPSSPRSRPSSRSTASAAATSRPPPTRARPRARRPAVPSPCSPPRPAHPYPALPLPPPRPLTRPASSPSAPVDVVRSPRTSRLRSGNSRTRLASALRGMYPRRSPAYKRLGLPG
jgi:hypothetical protein